MMGHRNKYQDKLEALQEKEIAEKLIISKDYAGARDKLNRAKHLFPLDHIGPMQSVCHILSAASIHFPGCEIDYYWILHLVPTSTMSDIRQQYQKLVTLLRPIKTKFPGTELALKLIQDAFSVLSDSDKRTAFDSHRRNMWTNYESLPIVSRKEVGSYRVPLKSGKLCIKNLGENTEDCLLIDRHETSNKDFGARLLASQEISSNSTAKNSEGNMAVFTVDGSSSLKHSLINLKQDSSSSLRIPERNGLNQDFYNFDDDRKVENLKGDQIWAVHYQSNGPENKRYAKIITSSNSTVSVTWLKPVPVSHGERRWCEAGLPIACGSFCLDMEMNEQVISPMVFSYNCSSVSGLTLDQFDFYPRKGEVWALYEDWNLHEWSYNPDATKCCQYKLVEIFSDFSKYSGVECVCLVKVHGFRSIFQRQTQERMPITFHISPGMLYILSHRVPAFRLTGGEIEGVIIGMLELDQLALPDSMIAKLDDQGMLKTENLDSSSFTCLEENLPHIIPCPEIEVLESNQLLNAMARGQIWAVYDGRDSMPRQFVLIENVISPTQVCVTFLEPEPTTDLEINWKEKNLPISCGVFRNGGTNLNLEISQLSHPVKFEKNLSGYMIYPLKGQIWAMYQGWDCKWDRFDPENSRYWILEILSDFSEGEKIVVARLGEVKDYFTFFVRLQLDGFELICEIPETEILSFSHEIPFFKVPGVGCHGVPESSWHLEPKALPPRQKKTI